MPNIRIGFSSDFVLKNGVVGLGTTVGSTIDGKLELDNGDIRANFSVSGVATLTAYGGFRCTETTCQQTSSNWIWYSCLFKLLVGYSISIL